MNILTSLTINKFIALLVIAVTAVVVLATILHVGPQKLMQRGPAVAMAYWDDNGNWVEDGSSSTDTSNPASDSYVPGTWSGPSSTPWLNASNDDGSFRPDTSTQAQPVSNPAPAAPQKTITYQGGRCKGNDAWWVIDYSDGTTNWVQNWGQQPGECGNPAANQPAPSASAAPAAPVAKTVTGTRTYGQCGGTVGLEGLDKFTQYEIVETTWSDGTKTYQNNGGRGDNPAACGQRPAPAAPAAPVVQAQSGNTQSNNCGNGSNINGSNINCSNNVGGTTTTTQTVINNGTQTQAVNSPVIVTQQVPVVRTITVAAPQVVAQATTETKELPKTGLPFAGWMLGGLAPLGLKVRKFGATAKGMLNANSIWEARQFSK